ncbi:hypothetical protein PI124_g20279 [Phytophthora idaei]|nr:hypothetical protein PI125_g21462 [Phytophthora idaei]KAG3121123.1 hypothetical protein PI126_g24464 [Phytophthora idaei]KAG3234674.1 hypothetical protein PI124_g20279 [Phytophthora idaei]
MEYEQGAENQSESATHIARADCPHLSDPEWEALQRLATVIGEAPVATMLRTLSPTEKHGVALGFIVKESEMLLLPLRLRRRRPGRHRACSHSNFT